MVSSFFIGSGFAVCALIVMMLLLFVFIYKNKKWTLQSSIFFIDSFITILILVLEILISYTIINRSSFPTLNIVLCRIFLFLNIMWFFLATAYVISVFINKENKKKIKIISIVYLSISLIVSLLFALKYRLTFDICVEGQPCFISGSYYLIMKIISIISSTSHISILFFNRKKVNHVNMISIFFLGFMFLIGNLILYISNIELNILSITLAATIVILFFTIENQDIKLLEEYEAIKKESIKSDKAKTNFLVNMSHEIRTPLSTILGFGQTLLYKSDLTEEVLKKDLLNIKKANNNLLNLITSLSDISRLENNKVVLNEEDYSLESLIFEIYSYIPPKIVKENLKFNIKVNPNIPKKYYGDAAKIYKAITYVILNAIEYTNYGEITLFIDAHKKEHSYYELEFIVSNTGHAMQEKNFNLTFNDYIELSDNANNVSLNLIIAKELINLNKGKIEFINKSGQGTKYIIKVDQKNYSEEILGNIFENHTVTNLSSDLLNCSNKRVLIVDDKTDNLSIMSEYLENYHFEIISAKSGKEAVSALQRERFDIVFLDETMSDMSGLDVLITIKTVLPNLPIMVILLNNTEVSKSQKFILEGFNDYLEKPIIFKNLNKLINKYFKNENK